VRSVGKNLWRESDRSCAIILSSLIDEVIQDLIAQECNNSIPRLKDRMFGAQSGMLPNFAKRIFFVMALKWVTTGTFHNLNIIRKIRNEFAHNIACDIFSYPKIRSFLASISPQHRDLFEASIKPALNDYLSGTTLSDILVEYDKKERFFFVVECTFIIDRLVAEMCVFPEAQRQQISPIDVMRDFESMPENLKETKRGTARLLLYTAGSTFGLGFYLERRSDAAAT
jgi:hypothetical protein